MKHRGQAFTCVCTNHDHDKEGISGSQTEYE